MLFIVIEVQSDGTTASTIVNSYTDRNQAESKFHQILTAAALSNVPIHSAVLMTDRGKTLKTETYTHEEVEE